MKKINNIMWWRTNRNVYTTDLLFIKNNKGYNGKFLCVFGADRKRNSKRNRNSFEIFDRKDIAWNVKSDNSIVNHRKDKSNGVEDEQLKELEKLEKQERKEGKSKLDDN